MNQTKQVNYLIVGAGLSGLTTAYELWKAGEKDFLILEARDRIGGRILTSEGIDLGATWFQTHHEALNELVSELEVEKFPQYSKGINTLVYSSMAPPHHFESDPNAVPASRIVGGSVALIEKLVSFFPNRIQLGSKVSSLSFEGDSIRLKTSQEEFEAEKVVITLPPKLASMLNYTPELPEEVIRTMKQTHTWMSNAMKVGLTFSEPFWRSKGLSGTILGQNGPVVELYDHSSFEEESFALMGFINEALRDLPEADRKERILGYLSTHLGAEVRSYLSYQEKDWSTDACTSDLSLKSIYMSPQYGHPVFQEAFMDARLLFAGAETSPVYGGYMDGAVRSGIRSAAALLSKT